MYGKKRVWNGVEVGCSERRGSFTGDSLEPSGDDLLRVYLFFFFLFRMSGEYPNSVSICKYLQAQSCPWSPITSLSSFNSMTPRRSQNTGVGSGPT